MKKCSILVGVLFTLFFASSCKKKITGDGPTVTQTRAVKDFTRVSLNIPATMYVTQDPGFELRIEAQQNILDIIETPVNGDELRIKFDNGKRIGSHDKIIVRVSAPVYNSLHISGTGEISSSDLLQSGSLKLSLSGSGNFILAGVEVTDRLEAFISGSGNMQVNNGIADRGSLNISGSGNLEMLGVSFKTAETRISGSGNIKASVTDRLDAHISGSGSVFYKGSPAVNTQVSGSGSVKKVS